MKVLDIENIKIVGKNRKYIKGRKLSPEYTCFKDEISWSCVRMLMEPPYQVSIYLKCYHDIDAPVQAILDAMNGVVIDDDRNIIELHIHKDKIKRGANGSIKVFVSTYNGI